MKKIIEIFIVCVLIIMLIGCDGNADEHIGEAKTPSGSSIQEGRDYKEVIEDFEKKGFINIRTEVLDDLINGWITKDGEVEMVIVDGDENYSPDVWYPNDVEVVINYHTFPVDEEIKEVHIGEDTEEVEVVEETEKIKPQKNGYDEATNQIITLDKFSFQVPKYWQQLSNENGYYKGYAETNGKVAQLYIQGMTDEEDAVNFEILNEEKEKEMVISNFLNSFEKSECLDTTVFETGEIKGILYNFTYLLDGYSGSGSLLCFPSEDDNKWFYVTFLETDNTEYAYDEDFIKIINSIKKSEVADDYSEINQLIYEDLLMSQGWALGKLDGNGDPTENGTPSPVYKFSLFVSRITYYGDKLRISVIPEFKQLNDDDKTYIVTTVQNMVNVHTKHKPYTSVLLDGEMIGHSKVTNSEAFKWK